MEDEVLKGVKSRSQKKSEESGVKPVALTASGSSGTLVNPPPSPVKTGGSMLSFFSSPKPTRPTDSTPSSSSKKFTLRAWAEDSGLLVDSEEFVKKWSGPLILGPFVPAIFAAITIAGGNIVLNTWKGSCDAPLDVFVTFAVVISYLFLILYSWVILGDDLFLPIPLTEYRLHLLSPFRNLKMVVVYYSVLFFVSFILWCIGTSLIRGSLLCVTTAPVLFRFSLFLCIIYWLIFLCVVGYVIKMKFGANIVYLLGEVTRERTKEEVEEAVFKKEWMKIDTGGKYYMYVDDVPFFLSNLGIGMPQDQVDALIQSLEPTEDNRVDYFKFIRWFRAFNSSVNEEIKDRPDVDDLLAFDETAVKRRKKQKRDERKTKKDKRRFFDGNAMDKYRADDEEGDVDDDDAESNPGSRAVTPKSKDGAGAQDDDSPTGEPETEEEEAGTVLSGKAAESKKSGKK